MAKALHGVIPRVQAQRAHHEFLDAVAPETVMLNLVEARKLTKRDETANSYFDTETSVIVTSTVSDRDLDLISWEKERDIIKAFAPDYHIPTDFPTYGNHSFEERIENVRLCMAGTFWMTEQLADTVTTLIPLIKGLEPAEREICYRAAAELDADYCAYYATQYFSSGQGNNVTQLVEDITAIEDEWGGDLLLIGLLSPNYLSKLPETVVAAAGMNAWRTNVTPRTQTNDEMRCTFATLADDVDAALAEDGDTYSQTHSEPGE